MSSGVPIDYIDVRVFAHATEDATKVLVAVGNTLPKESVDEVIFKKTRLTGHYRNPIILFEARIKDKTRVKELFEKLASGLSNQDKELLSMEIRQHLDKGNLYVRLNKQSAYLNELRLSSRDPIRLKIHFKKSNPEEIVKICKKFGMLP